MADSIEEARARMIAKRFGGNNQGACTGGGGTARRKKKSAHKTANADDKKLGAALKKLGCTNITGIEEVNIFKDNEEIIHFSGSKMVVQASIQSNLYVVSGSAETRSLKEMLPKIYDQLGASDIASLSKMLASQGVAPTAAPGAAPSAMPQVEEEDEDIPDLVDNFEEVSKTS
mmetsp:Transcript_35564/g.36251  ORF Transcript_35564/g.36251 Transcript_35564/m.36251 type:complete len:173 (+) Transcript_35564:98-616(+)|eukprot:CAMPEP_0182428868 /NCGR_PEP_ID=MMETSP1167-20130531/24310_1 /TAXON_ID=2988 /ORGANISM="Mallomonas Sp, Strain CCMP3275" /LENGTH=172 /DNA_ID=CAMNT_0024612051 /DNA_START=95 /DNA_END=613 /DNA_ORIENTATION=+